MDKRIQTKALKKLANLQFAIGLLFAIGLVIAVGTIIEQDKNVLFYKENYPEEAPIFGFLTWKIITFLNLNNLYSAWWFLFLLFLFGLSLLACTFTTQLPSLKTFKLWKFFKRLSQYKSLNANSTLQLSISNTFTYNCNSNKYHFFRQKNKGYAYSGLLGRVAPIVVHGSIIVLLIGSTIGSLGGYTAQELIPRGEIFHTQNMIKFGQLSNIPQDTSCRINDFWITYTNELKTDQFYSDLSLIDKNGTEVKRKTIFVNEPLEFNGLTFYQTDWDIVGLKLRFNKDNIFQIPVQKINQGGRKFWFGSLNLQKVTGQNLTVLITDLNKKVSFYDSAGVLTQELNLGDSFEIENGINLQFVDYLTSTGLQIKSDPGIFTIYLSFLLLMVSIYVSFFTYSQIWVVEIAKRVNLGGKSNRAVLFFQEELRKIVKRTKQKIA